MGPAATVDFLAKLVRSHTASRDQDHPPCILYNATQIPDRTAHLLGDGGEDPGPALQAAARVLQEAGADAIAIPCNSAHAYLGRIRTAVEIPVLDMIALTATATRAAASDATRAGILAATGTVRTALYDEPLRDRGIEPVYPDDRYQESVMAAVRAIKAGGPTAGGPEAETGPEIAELRGVAEHLLERDVDVLVAACTEIPLVLGPTVAGLTVVDATRALVDAALAVALGKADPATTAEPARRDAQGPPGDPGDA